MWSQSKLSKSGTSFDEEKGTIAGAVFTYGNIYESEPSMILVILEKEPRGSDG